MKQLYASLLMLTGFTMHSQNIVFSDPNFKIALVGTLCADLNDDGYADSDADTNDDGEIQVSEALAVYSLFTGTSGGPPPFRVSGTTVQESPAVNNISDLTGISYFTNLKRLHISNNLLTSLDVSMLPAMTTLRCANNQISSLTLGNLPNLTFLECTQNSLTSLDLSGTGAMVNLQCGMNQLPVLNIQNLAALKYLDCSHNNLTGVDVSQNTAMLWLRCRSNQITSLDVGNLLAMTELTCSENNLSTLNISSNIQLQFLGCRENSLTLLDVSNLPLLETVDCANNQLTAIAIVSDPMLSKIYAGDNLLQTIDAGSAPVVFLDVADSPNLTQIFLKNGAVSPMIIDQFPAPPMEPFNFTNTPALEFICGDEDELAVIASYLNGQNVNVTSFCSFAPGGNYNTIAGNVKYDCGGTNQNLSNLKLQINDGTEDSYTFSGNDGNYDFYVGNQAVTITPAVEHAEYFAITPANYQLSFSSGGNSETADFCIAPNGDHADLGISLTAMTPARPGFDGEYRIIYQNKGTVTQSGEIMMQHPFFFNETQLVQATPAIDWQTDTAIAWNFSDLHPFETRIIYVTIHVNSPTDTPPVYIGDQLNFGAGINSALQDEDYVDNSSALMQTVVGSFDPNDKMVAESYYTPELEQGKILHYMIRFQNTGTAPAENVIVTDELSALLNVSTLEITAASHPFRSMITGNHLEFYFENINLPDSATDEPASHGYIAFSVKPLNSVAEGEFIDNTAKIYFDYNFPIVTNTVTTTVAGVLNNPGNETNDIAVYPNPAKNHVTLTAGENSQLKNVSIVNLMGQTVKAILAGGVTISVDVSDLSTGTYFVKVTTDSGTTTKKLLKL